jgi:hypothetical protein
LIEKGLAVFNPNLTGIKNPLLYTAFLAVFLIAGCGGTTLNPSAKGDPNEKSQPSFADFSDMPIPASARMDVDRSLILGPKENWLGRLVFRSSNSASESFDFYANGMQRFGWQSVAVVRGAVSAMTYTRNDRVASIQIVGTTFGGSEVTITVSPQGGNSGGGSFGGGASPAPRGGGIQSAPLAP